jgi:Lipoxygenase
VIEPVCKTADWISLDFASDVATITRVRARAFIVGRAEPSYSAEGGHLREALRDLFVLNWEKFRRSRLCMWIMRPVLIFLITLKSLFTRQRMSHENGFVLRGQVRILDDLNLPANAFFHPGRTFPCRLRHASVSFLDDAGLVVRGASIKFADAPIDSPFDMLMNTGTAAPFWNLDTFWQFTVGKLKGGRAHLVAYFKRNPRCYMNVRAAVRRDPDSYSDQHYHSQTPLQFIADDGKLRYAKFRLLPAVAEAAKPGTSTSGTTPVGEALPLDGVPREDELTDPWFQEALSHEPRSRNYLKDEYHGRLKRGPVRYRFQIQLLDWQDGDSRDYELSSLYAWDDTEFPWRDLAEVDIVGSLSYHEGNECLFSLSHLPPALRVIPALGYEDGPSIDYARLGGMVPRRARLLAYRLLGQPPPIPDTRTDTALTFADETTSTTESDDVFMAARLPQQDTAVRQITRARHLEVARGSYQFMHGFIETEATQTGQPWQQPTWFTRVFNVYEPGPLNRKTVPIPLPPFIRKLAASENYSAYISGRLYRIIGASFVSLVLSLVERWLLRWRGAEAYRHLFLGYRQRPLSMNRWRLDAEFGRQRLAGVNPRMIRRFDRIPENFPVTDVVVHGLMDPGETLASAMARKRLYCCDYRILEGISVKEGRYLTQPITLFYVGSEGQFLPIAIQLFQSPDAGPIFTPNDDPGLWLAVKTFAQSADAQVHEVIEHLLHGHLIVEVFDVAMHRTLPDAHPINQLLSPHLEYTMAVNESARTKMLAPGGPIDRTMAVGAMGAFELLGRGWWEHWDFTRHDIPKDLAARGVDDAEALPNYPWRDDALRMWTIIERYVTGMVENFYATDQDVLDDWELQAFHAEIRGGMGGNVRGLPGGDEGFTGRTVLIEMLTRLIHAASVGHAGGNNGQFDYYGFIPNTPGALYHPPPADKTQAWTEKDLAEALPGFKSAAVQILMVRLLSRRTDMPLGTFPTSFFAGTDSVWPIVRRFRHDLHALSGEIQRRNAAMIVPYTYLDPQQVARSITA